MARFRDIDIFAFGNDIQLAGAIYADKDRAYALLLPNCSEVRALDVVPLDLDGGDWETLLKQLDTLAVQVENGTPEKAILRKSQRAVDDNVSWAVYRRDGYRCRYCGADDIPLSVDHLVVWEVGGPWTMENLVTSCKRDNKKRGRASYLEWLRSEYYSRISARLSPAQRAANEALLGTLDSIPRVAHIRSR